MISSSPLWFLPLLLYAEIHYKFKYFFSWLRKSEPEILADAPHRIEPGQKIPILFLVKDAHRYPCRLLTISVTVAYPADSRKSISLLPKPVELSDHWWWRIFFVDPPSATGWTEIDVSFRISTNGKTRTYRNDNYRTSSHRSLRVYIAKDPLPRLKNLHYGDCHTHSTYTEDQVEFGSPLGASTVLSSAMGLSFFCVADHSYDLDDLDDDYLVDDPRVQKWTKLADEIDTFNMSRPSCVVVRGEEVSSRNQRSRNVHFLLLGNERFFKGSGDSAERWLRTKSEHSIKEILAASRHGMGFAAHPQETIPLLQRVLLGRGQWEINDVAVPGLHGIQFLNGVFDQGFQRGMNLWVTSLLAGKRLLVIAGNDAHGNFNRFRQIGIPFLQIRESSHQLFGKMRTGVFLSEKPTEKGILDRIRQGNMIVTDGPAACFSLHTKSGRLLGNIGDACSVDSAVVEIRAVSTAEFGTLESIKLVCGTVGVAEKVILEERSRQYEWQGSLDLEVKAATYLRLEVTTAKNGSGDGLSHFCLTNPIWLLPIMGKQKSPSFKGLS